MPNERTRALRFAGEFIKELLIANETEKRRRAAQSILRHYPSAAEVKFVDQVLRKGLSQRFLPSTNRERA